MNLLGRLSAQVLERIDDAVNAMGRAHEREAHTEAIQSGGLGHAVAAALGAGAVRLVLRRIERHCPDPPVLSQAICRAYVGARSGLHSFEGSAERGACVASVQVRATRREAKALCVSGAQCL